MRRPEGVLKRKHNPGEGGGGGGVGVFIVCEGRPWTGNVDVTLCRKASFWQLVASLPPPPQAEQGVLAPG